VPADKSGGDSADKLRDTDLCYSNGSYSRGNCPNEPDCSFEGEWGKAKLCINRGPITDSSDTNYHVLVMKCIPAWENW